MEKILAKPRNLLQGLLLADSSEKMNSMNLLLHMAPIATVMLMPVVAVAEPTALQVAREKAALDKSTQLSYSTGGVFYPTASLSCIPLSIDAIQTFMHSARRIAGSAQLVSFPKDSWESRGKRIFKVKMSLIGLGHVQDLSRLWC